jgi:hypothetical protein
MRRHIDLDKVNISPKIEDIAMEQRITWRPCEMILFSSIQNSICFALGLWSAIFRAKRTMGLASFASVRHSSWASSQGTTHISH